MEKRIYLTGGTGFVGRYVLERLIADGNRVVVATRRPLAPAMPSGASTSIFDLEHPETLSSSALEGVDTVVHMAARVHVMHPTADEDRKLWQSNVVATDALARAAVNAGVRRFIYMSSIKVNGERTSGKPFTSSDDPAPADPYAQSKLASEDALRQLSASTRLEVAIVRPPLVYGPGVGANFQRLLALVARKVPLPLAAVNNQRSLVSVWNLADFIATIASRRETVRGTWLVADDGDLGTADLVRRIAAAMGRRPILFPVPTSFLRIAGRMLGREADVSRLCDSLQLDASPARLTLGWTPPVARDLAIDRTVKWFVSKMRDHG